MGLSYYSEFGAHKHPDVVGPIIFMQLDEFCNVIELWVVEGPAKVELGAAGDDYDN